MDRGMGRKIHPYGKRYVREFGNREGESDLVVEVVQMLGNKVGILMQPSGQFLIALTPEIAQ